MPEVWGHKGLQRAKALTCIRHELQTAPDPDVGDVEGQIA